MTGLRILVVDDDAVLGELLGEMLAEMGHQVCSIETTEGDAVRAAAELAPDLVIIDVRLGRGSGVAAVRKILLAGPTPHLFVSGDLRVVVAAMPSAAMLQKPYSEAQLAGGIRRAVAATPPK
jgi:DNA-binding response OmpR family regulator